MVIDLNTMISVKELRNHLFPSVNGTEHAAFLFSKIEGDILKIVDVSLLNSEDYDFQSLYHIQIRTEVIGHLIKRAHDLNASLVEVHSHIEQREAKFPYSDWSGFEEFVPHILWRLPDRPYSALVFTRKTFDAIYWKKDFDQMRPIEKLVAGSYSYYPTKLSKKPDRYYGL